MSTPEPDPEWTAPHRPGAAMRGPGNSPTALSHMLYELGGTVAPFRLAAPRTPEPYPLLTHYTSTSGLQGIIQSASVWATAYEYLNDTTEGTYGIELLGEAVVGLKGTPYFYSMEQNRFLEKLRTAIEAQRAQLSEERGRGRGALLHTCVACFTAEPDQLSQWRGYASGIGGISIQLPNSSVSALAELPDWRLVKCDYDGRIDPLVIVSLVQKVCSFWEENDDPSLEDTILEACAVLLIDATSDYLVQFKHPKFSEEAEWRLVSARPRSYDDLDYRPEASRLVPYAPVPLALPPTGRPESEAGSLHVTCGPNPQPMATRKAVQGYLWKHKIAAAVTSSQIPFR